jgi:L-ribulokinase
VTRLTGQRHDVLNAEAQRLAPGESGLLSLDWNNGNRSVLVDANLTGLIVGQTLNTTPAEIYRAAIEATAFGSLTIIRRIEACGVKVDRIINCGGIAEKSPLTMQIYSDVTNRPMYISRSSQTPALGAAMFGAVVGGVYKTVDEAAKAMSGLKDRNYQPNPDAVKVYAELYSLYEQLADAFGGVRQSSMGDVMKKLIAIRDRVRGLN